MDASEAARLIAEKDASDNSERGARLAELDALLGEGLIGFSGQAAAWLFEDVKATWIYGYFAATVLTAFAFCRHQLAGLIRMLPDDPALPTHAGSLEELAEMCERRGLIGVASRALLVALQDTADAYLSIGLHEHHMRLERRVLDAEEFTDEDPLLADARSALVCSVALLHRRL